MISSSNDLNLKMCKPQNRQWDFLCNFNKAADECDAIASEIETPVKRTSLVEMELHNLS